MKPPQELPIKKEIAPDRQANWGDSKKDSTIDQSFAYIKCLAFEKGINVHKTQTGFLVSQWCMAKHFANQRDLIQFLNKLGVAA